MRRQKIQKEGERLSFEIMQNKPNIDVAYPLNIIRKRELLLLGQVELEKIEFGDNIDFHIELYQTIMKHYFQQKDV